MLAQVAPMPLDGIACYSYIQSRLQHSVMLLAARVLDPLLKPLLQ